MIAGRFRLEAHIGAGGMGEVFRATHLELGVSVAVKLVGSATGALDQAVKRFRREARAAARLKSAHIVHVYDFGVDGDVPFLVMELLEGESLSERLARVNKLSPMRASSLVDQAARGLAAAHAQGIVHRDVKPSNLFLTQTPDGEILKVLDFGIAKPEEEDVTVTASQQVVGSPLYMSPEQANGEELDHRSDVWSLAAVAFRMVTGLDAFRGPTASNVLVKICSGTSPVPSAIARELSPNLDAIFQKAFTRDVSLRFQSTTDFARAFASAAQGLPSAELGPRAPGLRATGFLPATERARAELEPVAGRSTQFFRTESTVSLELLTAKPVVEDRRLLGDRFRPRRRWLVALSLGAPLALLLALLTGRAAHGPSLTVDSAGGSIASPPALRAIPLPPALPPPGASASSFAHVFDAPPAPSAAGAPSSSARAKTSPSAKSVARPSPSPSRALSSAEKAQRDPIFGL